MFVPWLGTTYFCAGVTKINLIMLKDRRILVEAELANAKHSAADRYLHLIRSGADPRDLMYQTLQGKVATLTQELSTIDHLIAKGQP
jgi:hypothetical protein